MSAAEVASFAATDAAGLVDMEAAADSEAAALSDAAADSDGAVVAALLQALKISAAAARETRDPALMRTRCLHMRLVRTPR
jgi:hypothetical protein